MSEFLNSGTGLEDYLAALETKVVPASGRDSSRHSVPTLCLRMVSLGRDLARPVANSIFRWFFQPQNLS